MNDLHSRATDFLRGPCCFARDEPSPKAVGLIQRYVDGESWGDPELLDQLSRCLRYAQTRAAAPDGTMGSESDARNFYQKAVMLLQEIKNEVLMGQVSK
jgi:hypothetical protein